MKLKIKKCGLVRKVENEKVTGFYGKVITNGKKTFDEITALRKIIPKEKPKTENSSADGNA